MHPLLEDAGEGLWPFALVMVILNVAWIIDYLPKMLVGYIVPLNILYWVTYGLSIVLAWENGRDLE